jgi:hypothetical protein
MLFRQGYTVANPVLLNGTGQYTTTYQNVYPVGQQEVTYTNYAASNQPNTSYNYVVGAGTAGSTVRNTTVEHSIAAPPKITFGHPSGGYANTYSISYKDLSIKATSLPNKLLPPLLMSPIPRQLLFPTPRQLLYLTLRKLSTSLLTHTPPQKLLKNLDKARLLRLIPLFQLPLRTQLKTLTTTSFAANAAGF